MDKNQNMYQASDGKWYPVEHMPQGYSQQGNYGGGYGQQSQMQYGGMQQQPIYVQQQQRPSGGGGTGAAAGVGCCAALCGMLLCFDLGACLF
ncbi:hypothetical protein CspeluHIS016_0209330 [Cutaneotrichosporon spelunceum]|uniref:Cysteine-rich transmembrane CYSTM domain-containing protein n=1 Tax=Cutaneotrichosporon spelunceum TaxID=1672016 RepID=A0AAD3TS72_9TREE|nr:hypothetical protein CspeluHIS016_0209330 [Cutaneotrichosporon spelunceum]